MSRMIDIHLCFNGRDMHCFHQECEFFMSVHFIIEHFKANQNFKHFTQSPNKSFAIFLMSSSESRHMTGQGWGAVPMGAIAEL